MRFIDFEEFELLWSCTVLMYWNDELYELDGIGEVFNAFVSFYACEFRLHLTTLMSDSSEKFIDLFIRFQLFSLPSKPYNS